MLFVAIFTFLLVTNGDPGHGIQAGSMVPWLKTADRWTIHRACTSFCLEIIWRIFGGRRVMVYIFTQVCEVVNNSSESVRCHSARVWNELPSSPPPKKCRVWGNVRLKARPFTARFVHCTGHTARVAGQEPSVAGADGHSPRDDRKHPSHRHAVLHRLEGIDRLSLLYIYHFWTNKLCFV